MQTLPTNQSVDNAELVNRCLRGDRSAFGEIVEQHQSMVCALTYSICGDIGRSQDLAQDTFITAWQNLCDLNEPANLKSWLCGIARNLARNAMRKLRRTPTSCAEPLPRELKADDGTPHEQAISKEEEALLWRALHNIPEAYREPMILFYREGQSTPKVAAALGLSEEAVRQRLSRGRVMLSERMARTVELTLLRSAPTKAFTLAALAALPAFATPAKAGTTGAIAGKAVAGAKSMPLAGWIGGSLAASFGSLFFLVKAGIDKARSFRERRLIVRMIWLRIALGQVWIFSWIMANRLEEKLAVVVAGGFVFTFLRVVACFRWQRIQIEDGAGGQHGEKPPDEAYGTLLDSFRSGSKRRVYAAWAYVLLIAGMAPAAVGSASEGHWFLPAAVLMLALSFFLRGGRGWERNQNFDDGFRSLKVFIGTSALTCLIACNLPLVGALHWHVSAHWVIGLNAGTILAHSALLALLYWRYPILNNGMVESNV